MTLKNKKYTLQVPGLIMDVIQYKDVKEAVLELKKNICYCDTNKFNEKICENCYFTFIALINIFMFEMYGGLINQWLVNLAIGLIGTSIIIYGYFKE